MQWHPGGWAVKGARHCSHLCCVLANFFLGEDFEIPVLHVPGVKILDHNDCYVLAEDSTAIENAFRQHVSGAQGVQGVVDVRACVDIDFNAVCEDGIPSCKLIRHVEEIDRGDHNWLGELGPNPVTDSGDVGAVVCALIVVNQAVPIGIEVILVGERETWLLHVVNDLAGGDPEQ